MGRIERWLLPGLFGTVGGVFLIAGGLITALLPGAVASHGEAVARLSVATLATLNEPGTQVLLEGWISDRTPTSDQPPLVTYRAYHLVPQRPEGTLQWQSRYTHTPQLWVKIPGGEVEIVPGYTLRSAPSKVEVGRDRYYDGFQGGDPVLVLGILEQRGDIPVVGSAQISFETQATYLAALGEDEAGVRWLGFLFLGLGSLASGVAMVTGYGAWQQEQRS